MYYYRRYIERIPIPTCISPQYFMIFNDFCSKDPLSFHDVSRNILEENIKRNQIYPNLMVFSSLKIKINMVFFGFVQLAISHDFQYLQNKIKNSLTFQVFHDPQEP